MQTKRPRYRRAGLEPDDSFISKTYDFFLMSLIGMFGFGVVGYHFPSDWLKPVAITDLVLWVFCGWLGWRRPIGFVFPLFTVVTGSLLGMTANLYAKVGLAHIMINAGVLTVFTFVGLSLYVLKTKRNFSGLIGFLVAGFWILLTGFALRHFFDTPLINVVLSSFGVLVFACWILFDTSRIVGRWDPELTPAIGAFELFLDIIGLFSYILDIFGIFSIFDD